MASETLRLDSFAEANLVEVTTVGTDVAAAASTVTLENVDNLAADDFLVIALPGSEQAEIRRISSITGQVVTLISALSFAHKKYERVTKIRGDQIRVYRATNVDGTAPADSSFALLAATTIQADQTYIEYTAATGGSGYWWKITYYNSVSLTETELSASPAKRGGGFGFYCTIERTRLEAGIRDNQQVTDQAISEVIAESVSIINGYILAAHYTLPLETPVPSVVEGVTARLAASKLLIRDHGTGAEGSSKDGYALEENAYETLEKIGAGQLPLIDDATGEEIAGDSAVDGWPDETTETAADTDGGGTRKFWANQKL